MTSRVFQGVFTFLLGVFNNLACSEPFIADSIFTYRMRIITFNIVPFLMNFNSKMSFHDSVGSFLFKAASHHSVKVIFSLML